MIERPDCAWRLSDLSAIPGNGVKVATTFSCGGGSSMGYRLAGCDVLAANDIDGEMQWHYQRNLNTPHYFLCSIGDLLKQKLPSALFDLDILDGSPPCTTFSMAGPREKSWGQKKAFREGGTDQILSDLFFDYLDVAAELKPRTIVAENVKGLIQGRAKGYVKLIVERFKHIGYRPQVFLINAADCGVPQRRERIFFVACRNDLRRPPLALSPRHRWISAGEATRDVQVLSASEIEDTRPAPTGRRWWPLTKKGETFSKAVLQYENRNALFNWRRLHDLQPAPALIAGDWDKNHHWDQCRYLTLREWKRIGGFPDDYEARNWKIGTYLVGMSVPPRLAMTIARAIVTQWILP